LKHSPSPSQGSRTREDQNALDVVFAALIHQSVFGKKLGRTVQSLFGVSWKAIVRAIECRESFEQNKHWTRRKRGTYRNKATPLMISKIAKWLHKDPAVTKVLFVLKVVVSHPSPFRKHALTIFPRLKGRQFTQGGSACADRHGR
jgi:hypothetical protein